VADCYYFEIFDCSQALPVSNRSFNLTPLAFSLAPPAPNPFNSATTINFTLDRVLPVKLMVYNEMGQEVTQLATCNLQLGTNKVVWNAEGLPSGVYIVKLSADGGQSSVQKVVLMK
jgi:hypothetical protein